MLGRGEEVRGLETEGAARARLLRQRAQVEPLWVPTSGWSMGRRYAAASRVLVRAEDRRPRPGEVWVFCVGSTVVAHRLLMRRGSAFVFAGDGAIRTDEPVAADCLVGRVVLVDNGDRRWRPRVWQTAAPMARAAWRRAGKFVFRGP